MVTIEIVDPNSSITNRKEKERIKALKDEDRPNKNIKKIKVSGNYDKRTIIEELEAFVTENQIVENHPDMKIEYQKHCDGWRGYIEYEESPEGPELLMSAGKPITKRENDAV